MNGNMWIQDLMTQKFLDTDITRIIMVYALLERNLPKQVCKVEIVEFIYRVYIENQELSEKHPDIRIRNIKRYGIYDIKYILDKALKEWMNNSKNKSLLYDDRYIYLAFDSEEKIIDKTKKIVNMLAKKYSPCPFDMPKILNPEDAKDDTDLLRFGKGPFRNRVFEDMQYCPLCEEIDIDNLYAVHILPSEYCNSDELIDKNNGLILCEDHAKEYIKGNFYFDERGFVKNNDSNLIVSGMHLSLAIKTKKRLLYIKKRISVEGDQCRKKE